MKKTFTLFDIRTLKTVIGNSSKANDQLVKFLDRYQFEDVFKTQDNSVVFAAGGRNDIEIEFFNFDNPITRVCSVMYYENGTYAIMNIC